MRLRLPCPKRLRSKKRGSPRRTARSAWKWKDLNVAGDVTTGELTAALLYLAEPGKPVAAGTEIELRARYFVEQAGQDGFYSAYSKVIGFGSDDIVINDTPATDNNGDDGEGSILDKLPKSDCPICHFCPQPLGLCIFIWLIIIVAVIAVVVVVVVLVKKKKNKADKEKKRRKNNEKENIAIRSCHEYRFVARLRYGCLR